MSSRFSELLEFFCSALSSIAENPEAMGDGPIGGEYVEAGAASHMCLPSKYTPLLDRPCVGFYRFGIPALLPRQALPGLRTPSPMRFTEYRQHCLSPSGRRSEIMFAIPSLHAKMPTTFQKSFVYSVLNDQETESPLYCNLLCYAGLGD